jgi:hypothetical protein
MSVEFNGYPFDPRVLTLPSARTGQPTAGLTAAEARALFQSMLAEGDIDAVSVLDYKQNCNACAETPIELRGEQVVDGVQLRVGHRVLVMGQADPSENGLYQVSQNDWRRTTDANADGEVTSGLTVFVSGGTYNGDRFFVLRTEDPIELGVTGLTFEMLETDVDGGSLDGGSF